MKVKLLKKVRKRYEIIKVSELGSDLPDYMKDYFLYVGLPCYHVIDKDTSWSFSRNLILCKTKELALTQLSEWILEDYSEQFRHKDGKVEKVWWTK